MDQKQKCRSIIVKKFGGYDSLFVEDFDLLSLKENIEVKVEYGGLNFADLYTRMGFMPDKKLPFILGMECTGVITKVGDNVKNKTFKKGQRVICYDYNGGMYREILDVSPDKCFVLPNSIDTKLGATIFVNYLTAYFSLINLGNLSKNDSVLILSCTGGVGSAAVQISKTIGVEVSGTGSKHKEIHAKKNGVDVFFCNDTFREDVKNIKFDVILSNESGPKFTFLQSLLKPLGRIVLIGANNMLQEQKFETTSKPGQSGQEPDHDNLALLSLVINSRVVAGLHLGLLLDAHPEKVGTTLELIFSMIEKKKLNPVIDSVWKMDEIVEATKLLEERRNIGKVLINIGGNVK